MFIFILPRGGLNDVDLAILAGRLLGDALLFLSRFTIEVWAFVFLVGDALLFLLRFSAACSLLNVAAFRA